VAIQARIGNLPGDVQETLTLGAIIGREFDFDTLTTTSLHDEDSLIIALETAERAQLIEEISGESGGTFNFVHALIPSTLTESISGLRRRRLHRSVAEAICHRRPGDYEALAYHYIEGGDLVNGLEYSLKAAEKARNVHSIEEATRYYERAAEIAESLERPQQLLTIYEEIGRLQSSSNELRAVDAFLQALELTQFPEKRAQLKSSIGAAYASIGDERGLPYLEQAVDELNPESQANALALAYSSTGRFHHYHGRHKKGLTFLERALQIAEPLGDVSVLTIIYANLAGLYQHLANYKQSLSWAQRLITLGEQIEFPPALALGYEFLAEDYFVMGEYQQAHEAALKNHELGESSLELALTTGDIRLAIIAEAQLAIIKADLGDLEEAGEIALSSINRMGELDQIFLLCSSLGAMVYWHLQQGDIQAALKYLERCDCAAAETDSRQVPLITGNIRAEVLLYTDRIDEALQIVEQQLQVSRDAPSRNAESRYLRVLAQIHAAQGNWEQSEITFDKAAIIQSDIGARLFLGQTLYYRGLMQRERGERETALVDLQHAQELFAECGANLWVGKARAAIK
jgi:tetratricopeptide (TPR) repeat protein